jgi:hypothetical protein
MAVGGLAKRRVVSDCADLAGDDSEDLPEDVLTRQGHFVGLVKFMVPAVLPVGSFALLRGEDLVGRDGPRSRPGRWAPARRPRLRLS